MRTLFLKKTTIIFAALLLGFSQSYSQTGCTDPLANNYDPSATQNDGSCTYDVTSILPTNSYTLDATIDETSGLIYYNNSLWTQNDSADPNLYELNPADGAITNSVSLAPEINQDWEEISQDEDYVYVGDFGNNVNGNRTNLHIIRVSKASMQTGTLEMDIINFVYADQVDFTPTGANNTDYDCEAFIVTDDSIYLFTKEWVSKKTRLYKIPKTPGTHQAQLQDTYNVSGLVTGSVYKKDEGIIALSGYSNTLQPFVVLLYDFTAEDFFGANKRKLGLNLPFHQIEGITTVDGLNYFITNEKFTTIPTAQKLHTLDLTAYLGGYLSVSPVEGPVRFKIYPNPVTTTLQIEDNQSLFPLEYTIFDITARQVKQGVLTSQNANIDVSEFSSGTYILKLGQKTINSFRIIKE